MPNFSLAVTDAPKPNAKIVTLTGEFDESRLEEIRKELDPYLNDAGVQSLIFDLTDLEFINSKGIGYFVAVHTHMAKDQRKLILVGAQPAVMDVISLVGLTTIIPYFETLKDALNS